MSTLLSASEAIRLNTGKPKVLSQLCKLTSLGTGELENWVKEWITATNFLNY
ncbi:MAG: hypothetical protein ACI88A_004097 [Paraglaciecola sp.]|jgi:hypothetical protein